MNDDNDLVIGGSNFTWFIVDSFSFKVNQTLNIQCGWKTFGNVRVSLLTEKLNWIRNLLLRSFCLQNIFSRNCCLKIKNRNTAIILVQNRPDRIRQYDITNIVLIAIRPYNNTQIMDIIEKYDLFYNIQQEIIEKILIEGTIQKS